MPESYLKKIREAVWIVFPFIEFDYNRVYYGDDTLTMKCCYKNKLYKREVEISQIFTDMAEPKEFDNMAKKIIKEAIRYFSNEFIRG